MTWNTFSSTFGRDFCRLKGVRIADDRRDSLLTAFFSDGDFDPYEYILPWKGCNTKHKMSSLWVTRKGAVSAKLGEYGIIPGSMGKEALTYIVTGRGNPESFTTCSHGAGRNMSRSRAKVEITLDEHVLATEGVVCRKDLDVIDESPRAYKNIEDVMAAQADLVKVEYALEKILNIKG